MANDFGHLFKLSSFGESHGDGVGVVVHGCPSGVKWDEQLLLSNLKRRAPGGSMLVSDRKEQDLPEILSGVFESVTLGTPIAMVVKNQNQRSADYDDIKTQPRVGHADDVWKAKFDHVDHRGGGRSSGRETLARVLAGSVAEMFVKQSLPGVSIECFPSAIYDLVFASMEEFEASLSAQGAESSFTALIEQKSNLKNTSDNPSDLTSEEFKKIRNLRDLLIQAKELGESYGGVASVQVTGLPKGLGQPVFHKFKADLASAMLSIGSTSGFEIGDGFQNAIAKGSELHKQENSKSYGGDSGGITTGELLNFKVAFKPPSSVLDIAKKGRHDPCVVLRALPVVESMTWLVIADHLLWKRLDRV
ncbi:MAG: chorismate synthase [Bdellovibrionaceae bacterium]|jgi:chorismate synthase|nr:chorismate synthase [Pseudobdellovibrionaceae bacterium]